ncbi:MAG: hypothetical protein ACLUUO_12965 [Sellimonas intestinalis]
MGVVGYPQEPRVAKDAASMVLTDDNFATIVKASGERKEMYIEISREFDSVSVIRKLRSNPCGSVRIHRWSSGSVRSGSPVVYQSVDR